MADMKTIDDPMDLGAVTAADFEPHLEELFEVPAGDVSVALRLIQVKETPAYTHPNATRTPFTLIFRGETEGALLHGDGGYVLQREGFGRIESVLITPIVSQEPGSGAMFYQICLT